MAKRRLPPEPLDSAARIRSRTWESEWARLPREEVWPRATPGGGPWGSVDGPRSVPTMIFVAGFGLVLLGIFLMFAPLIGLGVAAMIAGIIAGIVVVARRKGQRATLLWGGLGTTVIHPERRDTMPARAPISGGRQPSSDLPPHAPEA